MNIINVLIKVLLVLFLPTVICVYAFCKAASTADEAISEEKDLSKEINTND